MLESLEFFVKCQNNLHNYVFVNELLAIILGYEDERKKLTKRVLQGEF